MIGVPKIDPAIQATIENRANSEPRIAISSRAALSPLSIASLTLPAHRSLRACHAAFIAAGRCR